MEIPDRPQSPEAEPPDFLDLIRRSGVLSDRPLEEVAREGLPASTLPKRGPWPTAWSPRGSSRSSRPIAS